MILSISYDLHNPGRDYEDVIATIKTAPSYTHPQGSLWLIDTTLEPSNWVDKLKAAGDPNDEYLVSRLAHNLSWKNMDSSTVSWIKSPTRSWQLASLYTVCGTKETNKPQTYTVRGFFAWLSIQALLDNVVQVRSYSKSPTCIQRLKVTAYQAVSIILMLPC